MFHIIQILTITLVAIAMARALAHAFEFPRKKRLTRDSYVSVQGIYYPGFTLLGVSEPGGLIAVLVTNAIENGGILAYARRTIRAT